MNKKTQKNSFNGYSVFLLAGLAILFFFFFAIILNLLVNCTIIFANSLPAETTLPILIRQFQSINIVSIIIITIIGTAITLIILYKYKSMFHILSRLDIAITLLLVLNLFLIFAEIMPIKEEIEMYSRCCTYLDSQPSPWFWAAIVLLDIVISLSSALLVNTVFNRLTHPKNRLTRMSPGNKKDR